MRTASMVRSIKTGNKTSRSNRNNYRGHFFNGRPIQTKLTVNEPGDAYEQEADRVAGEIMNKPETGINQPFFSASVSPTVVQRTCSACEEEKLHRKESGQTNPSVTPSVKQTLSGSGSMMDTGTRSFMESRFGNDFSDVRIHNDANAHRSSTDISARAYTHGSHIVFGAGEYQPDTIEGKELLAHELTHVLQQRKSEGMVQRKFNFIRPNPRKTIDPVTVQYKIDTPIPRGQLPEQTKRNRSLGLTTPQIAGKFIAPDAIFKALNFRLEGKEEPAGTFKCNAVTKTTVDVSAEELVLVANSSNKWKGRFNDYPNPQCDGKRSIPVSILGDPDANAVETKVLQNEEEHVEDIKKATNDMNAMITKIESQVGTGDTEDNCKKDLLKKVGDPGNDIDREFRRRLSTDAAARDSGSHTLKTIPYMPKDCARIQFTLKV